MTGTAGLLLAGGGSRRLGVDKATLVLGGRTLAQRAASVLTAVCEPVLEVGRGSSGLAAVREEPPGSGPLAAIAAGADALTSRGGRGPVLVLAVDLPFVTVDVLTLLRDWPGAATVVPEVEGRRQLVCARYGTEALVAAGSLLAGGVRSLHELLDVVDHDVIGEPVWGSVATADTFADVDTPDDARRLGVDPAGLP